MVVRVRCQAESEAEEDQQVDKLKKAILNFRIEYQNHMAYKVF